MAPTKVHLSLFALGLLTSTTACPAGSKGSLDEDGDGYEVGEDCDDLDPDVNPGEVEICDDGVDNDCDGVDASCAVDSDGDGWDAAEDCDDNDASIHPGATEDCYNGTDDNCDGVATECLDATMVYEPAAPASFDPYAAAVFGNRVVFGEPQGHAPAPFIGDGRALLFELQRGTVDAVDAIAIAEGEIGLDGAHGTVLTPVGAHLCIGADYEDFGTQTDAGKARCFAEATVEGAVGTLPATSAAFSAAGELTEYFTNVDGEVDVDGDGNADLLVYTSRGLNVIYGNGSPWSGDYVVPSDADVTLGDCSTSGSGWCGFGRALSDATQTFAFANEGGPSDEVSLYEFPLPGGSTVPVATAQLPRAYPDSATAVATIGGFAFGSSDDAELTFIDSAGTVVGVVADDDSGSDFGYWSTTVEDQSGHELLLVSAPFGAAPGGVGDGVVYVYDLTRDGLPTDADQAKYILVAPNGFVKCGHRARAGLVVDGDGSSTTVALTCTGSGGAAYILDYRPPPAPLVSSGDIYGTGGNQFAIKQWVVDAYTSRLAWLDGLAQTELVEQGGSIVGWRLHAIEPGSPLFLAGLRSGDVLRRVDGNPLTTPASVRALYQALKDADGVTLGITRNGANGQLHYAIVP